MYDSSDIRPLGLNKRVATMRQHVKHSALAFGLALSVISAVVLSTPFTATPAAQSVSRMVGPQFPILMDNGDGLPGPGDLPLLIRNRRARRRCSCHRTFPAARNRTSR